MGQSGKPGVTLGNVWGVGVQTGPGAPRAPGGFVVEMLSKDKKEKPPGRWDLTAREV